jgi:hypothetical protein
MELNVSASIMDFGVVASYRGDRPASAVFVRRIWSYPRKLPDVSSYLTYLRIPYQVTFHNLITVPNLM